MAGGSVVGLKAKLGVETDEKQVDREVDSIKGKLTEAAEAEMSVDVTTAKEDIKTSIEQAAKDSKFMPDIDLGTSEGSPRQAGDRLRGQMEALGRDTPDPLPMGRPSGGGVGGAGGTQMSDILGGMKGAGGKFLKVGLAGAVGFGILSAVTNLAGSAPRFNKTLDMLKRTIQLFARPFLELIGKFLQGPVTGALEAMVNFNQVFEEEGLIDAGVSLKDDILFGGDDKTGGPTPLNLPGIGGTLGFMGGGLAGLRAPGGMRTKLAASGLGALGGGAIGSHLGGNIQELLGGDFSLDNILSAGGAGLGLGAISKTVGLRNLTGTMGMGSSIASVPGALSSLKAGGLSGVGKGIAGGAGRFASGLGTVGRGLAGRGVGRMAALRLAGSAGAKALGPLGWAGEGIARGTTSLMSIAGGGKGQTLGKIGGGLSNMWQNNIGGGSGGGAIHSAFTNNPIYGAGENIRENGITGAIGQALGDIDPFPGWEDAFAPFWPTIPGFPGWREMGTYMLHGKSANESGTGGLFGIGEGAVNVATGGSEGGSLGLGEPLGNPLGGGKVFASGGFVTGPTQGIVGEAGAEVIAPFSQFMNALNAPDRRVGDMGARNGSLQPDMGGRGQGGGGGASDEVRDLLRSIDERLGRLDPEIELSTDRETLAKQSQKGKSKYESSTLVTR